MNRKGLSLVGVKSKKDLVDILDFFPNIDFELSYAMNNELLHDMLPLIKGHIASIHSLCPRRAYFPNFATNNNDTYKWSQKELMADVKTAKKVGSDILVLHPGYMTDQLVSTNPDIRIKMMEDLFSVYVMEGTSSIARPEYKDTPEYRKAFEIMTENILEMSRLTSEEGVTLAIENLNPRSGYMFIHPDEMIELSRFPEIHFTLDIGHLWITTELYGLDFLDTVTKILDTGKVVTTHLHSNPSDRNKLVYEDKHQSLDSNSMPWKKTLSLIEQSGANMMLETVEKPLHNLELLLS